MMPPARIHWGRHRMGGPTWTSPRSAVKRSSSALIIIWKRVLYAAAAVNTAAAAVAIGAIGICCGVATEVAANRLASRGEDMLLSSQST